MRGSSRPRTRERTAATPVAPHGVLGAAPLAGRTRKRVLFVCLGNSCRSQMAQGFARAYGPDIVLAESAGLSPATIVQPLTLQIMREKNIPMDGHFPKGLETMARQPYDLVINMSGQRFPLPAARVIDWPVPDPIGRNEQTYRRVAQQIEGLVMQLILDLRSA